MLLLILYSSLFSNFFGFEVDTLQSNELSGEELRQLGIAKKRENNYEEARRLYELSLAKFESDQDSLGIANVENSLGFLESQLGYYNKSLKHLYRAEDLFLGFKDFNGLGKVQLNIAGLFFLIEEFDSSIEYYKKALESCKIEPNNLRIANIQVGIANVLSNERYAKYDLNQSTEFYNNSLTIFENLQDSVNISMVYNNLARIYSLQGRFEQSIQAYQKFYIIVKSLDNKELQIVALSNMSKLLLNRGRYNECYTYLKDAEKLAIEISKPSDYIHILSLMVDANIKLGNADSAAAQFLKYKEIKDSLFNEEKSQQMNELQVQYETKKREEELRKEVESNREKQIVNRTLIILIALLVISILLIFYFNRQKKKSDLLRLQNEKRITILSAQIEGEEKERKRIAQDLHDGVSVLLTSAKMMHSKYVHKSGKLGERVHGILSEASNAIREVSHNLSSSTLERFGLFKAIEQYFHLVENSSQIETNLINNIENLTLRQNVTKVIDYVVRELTNNTLKYANATELSLQIMYENNQLYISYEDDGNGFDMSDIKYGLGLESIKARVASVDGTILFDSDPGNGFVCTIEISDPLEVGQTN